MGSEPLERTQLATTPHQQLQLAPLAQVKAEGCTFAVSTAPGKTEGKCEAIQLLLMSI